MRLNWGIFSGELSRNSWYHLFLWQHESQSQLIDRHIHLAWQILIKFQCWALIFKSKLKNSLWICREAVLEEEQGHEELEHALKRWEGLVYVEHVELMLLAMPQQSDHNSCLWISWKINTRTGSQHCPEPSRKTSKCAANGAPRSLFPWLMLVLWAELSLRWCRESAAASLLCGWLFLRVWNAWNDHIFSQKPRENALFTTLPPDGVSLELSAALAAMINVRTCGAARNGFRSHTEDTVITLLSYCFPNHFGSDNVNCVGINQTRLHFFHAESQFFIHKAHICRKYQKALC